MTEFVIRNIVLAARKVIEQNERQALTEKDSLYVLELLNEPPAPNEKLMAAAFVLPKHSYCFRHGMKSRSAKIMNEKPLIAVIIL